MNKRAANSTLSLSLNGSGLARASSLAPPAAVVASRVAARGRAPFVVVSLLHDDANGAAVEEGRKEGRKEGGRTKEGRAGLPSSRAARALMEWPADGLQTSKSD